MATKKRAKKKVTRAKKTAGGKVNPTKKRTKKASTKPARKTSSPNEAAAKKKTSAKTTTRGKTARMSSPQRARKKSPGRPAPAFLGERPAPRSDELSGDLQGLSDIELADSESVDELVEEGNAFEAGVIAGVEEAEDDSLREVHTHEVPEGDVPEEYLDKD